MRLLSIAVLATLPIAFGAPIQLVETTEVGNVKRDEQIAGFVKALLDANRPIARDGGWQSEDIMKRGTIVDGDLLGLLGSADGNSPSGSELEGLLRSLSDLGGAKTKTKRQLLGGLLDGLLGGLLGGGGGGLTNVLGGLGGGTSATAAPPSTPPSTGGAPSTYGSSPPSGSGDSPSGGSGGSPPDGNGDSSTGGDGDGDGDGDDGGNWNPDSGGPGNGGPSSGGPDSGGPGSPPGSYGYGGPPAYGGGQKA